MSSSASESFPSARGGIEIATVEDLHDYASKTGTKISLTTLGPGYRAVARAADDDSVILGYVEGFIRPGGKILHVDKMEMFRPTLKRTQKSNPTIFTPSVSARVGLLLGLLAFLHGKEKGCIDAEFLAIDDEPFQHKRLVRYFTKHGFVKYRYVGDDVQNIPDRLIWGGRGALMGAKIEKVLPLWTKQLFRNYDFTNDADVKSVQQK